jgi:hypothetical protein
VRRRLLSLLALVYGLVLVGLAWPRTEARLQALPGDAALRLLEEGQLPTQEGLDRVLESRLQALRSLPDPTYVKERGIALFGQARVSDDWLERARLLADAAAALEEGLAKAPADPAGWAYLALVQTQSGDAGAALEALDQSYVMGAFNPEVALMRSYVAVANWDWLDPLQSLQAEDDLIAAASRDPQAVVALARAAELVDPVREALAVDPNVLERFDRTFAKMTDTQ